VDLSPGERRSGAHAARREAGPAPRAFDAQIDPPDRFVRLCRPRLTP